MKILGIIPARLGSKRVPRKNIRELGGKPLIVWTIEAAQRSELLTDLVCSTDDEIAREICHDHGVEVIDRPPSLATDEAKSEDVVLHVISLRPCDYLCLLQPTSPFRSADLIDRVIREGLKADTAYTTNDQTPNGAVYVAKSWWVQRHRVLYPSHRMIRSIGALDIDTEEDFAFAETCVGRGRVDWDG